MKKKLLALLFAGCMVLSMTACGNKETQDITQATEETDLSALGTSTLTSLGEYKGVTYVPMDTTVTEEEVELEVQYLLAATTSKDPQEVATETVSQPGKYYITYTSYNLII